MLSTTARRALERKVIKAMRIYAVWSSAELRDRPEALRERNEALIIARRTLDELLADHHDEIAARLRSVPKAAGE
jgi:hypothetical protein